MKRSRQPPKQGRGSFAQSRAPEFIKSLALYEATRIYREALRPFSQRDENPPTSDAQVVTASRPERIKG